MIKFSASELQQLYLEWPLSTELVLPRNPCIVVAGAYQGKLLRMLAEMYPEHTAIVGFEPQEWAYRRALDATRELPRVSLINHGLYAAEGYKVLTMGEFGTDACSVLEHTREQGEGMFHDALRALESYYPIDLLVANMEGYEYLLLPYLVRHKAVEHIEQVAVQFHIKYIPSPDTETRLLTDMDAYYGYPIYDDYPKWVYWRKV